MAVGVGSARPERAVYWTVLDMTVLCVAIAAGGRQAVAANERHGPAALAHAEGHLDTGGDGVWICAPECDGD